MRAIFALILIGFFVCASGCASAPAPAPTESAPTGEAGKAPTDSGPFTPSVPEPKKFDWVRLTSGEWLKGDITVLREDSLEFDSKELDDLKLDWDKIAELRSSRNNSVLIDDGDRGEGHTGTLVVTKDTVTIVNAEGSQEFPRDRLMVIVPGNLSEKDYWDGTISLGIAGKAGNVNQVDLTLYGLLRRRTLESRWVTTYNGAFGTVEDEETVDNHRLNSQYDWFLGRKWYFTPMALDYYRDRFKNIEHQITPAVLAGYHVVDTRTMEWDLQAGLGYRYTRFDSVQAGEDTSDGTAAIIVGTTFNWDITSDIEFHLDYNIQVGVPETVDTNQFAFLTLSIDLIGDLDLDLSLTWNRVGDPQPNANGTTPLRDDLRYTVGFGWDF